HHSVCGPAGGQGVPNPSGRTCSAPVVADATVPTDIGDVRITECASADPATNSAFADGIQRQIRAADRADLAGWIVDVRGNGGGNMWPLFAAVGPVVGSGLLGYFVPPAGQDHSWAYSDGRATIDGSTL